MHRRTVQGWPVYHTGGVQPHPLMSPVVGVAVKQVPFPLSPHGTVEPVVASVQSEPGLRTHSSTAVEPPLHVVQPPAQVSAVQPFDPLESMRMVSLGQPWSKVSHL